MPKIDAKTISSFVSQLQQRRPSVLSPVPFIGRKIVDETVKQLDEHGYVTSPSGLTANIAAMWLGAKKHRFVIERIDGFFVTYDLGPEPGYSNYHPTTRLQELRS